MQILPSIVALLDRNLRDQAEICSAQIEMKDHLIQEFSKYYLKECAKNVKLYQKYQGMKTRFRIVDFVRHDGEPFENLFVKTDQCNLAVHVREVSLLIYLDNYYPVRIQAPLRDHVGALADRTT